MKGIEEQISNRFANLSKCGLVFKKNWLCTGTASEAKVESAFTLTLLYIYIIFTRLSRSNKFVKMGYYD